MILALLVALQEAGGIWKEIEVANAKDRPQLHGEAMRRLQARGAAAVAGEIERYVGSRGRNALSISFTEGLGGLREPRLTKLLRELSGDRNFFWRPAAMRALVDHADPACRDLFRAALSDPLWGCRTAAVAGLGRLGDRESLAPLRERLADEIYDVRAQAARTLHAMGDASGLPVLVDALRSDVRWFDIDYGQVAREDAWNFLKGPAGGDFGYKPWETEAQRAPGLAKFEAWMAARDPNWRDAVPERVRARPDRSEYVFGLERRSCQRGDFFLRIDREGNLVLGCFNLERARLTAEERARFDDALAALLKVDRKIPYGQGGCDFEQYHLRVGERFEKLWTGLRGRPAEAERWIRVVRELLRSRFGEGVAEEFRQTALLFQAEE